MDQRLITLQWRLLDRNPPEEGKRQLKCSDHRSPKRRSMITTGYMEITFFFLMSISNVDFHYCIFNVDFRCGFSMLIFKMFSFFFNYMYFVNIFSA